MVQAVREMPKPVPRRQNGNTEKVLVEDEDEGKQREKIVARERQGTLGRRKSLSKGTERCLNITGSRTIGNSIAFKEGNGKR